MKPRNCGGSHHGKVGVDLADRAQQFFVIDTEKRYIEDVIRASFPVLDYNREAADWHAFERARLSAEGRTRPFVDGQIAAIAYVNDLVLITSNAADFEGFEGLRVRNWARQL